MPKNTLELLERQTRSLPHPFTPRTPNGDVVWTWLVFAFAAYWLLFITGALTERRELNFAGAVIILVVLGWAALERLWVKVDGVVIASIAVGIIPLISMLAVDMRVSTEAVIKHLSLCIVMAVSRLLYLPIASRSKVRWIMAIQILLVLGVCLVVDRGDDWDGGTRRGGYQAADKQET